MNTFKGETPVFYPEVSLKNVGCQVGVTSLQSAVALTTEITEDPTLRETRDFYPKGL